MPMYDYKCKGCKDVVCKQNSIADRRIPCETPCEKCGGEINILIGTPKVVSSVSNKDKRPGGWRDVLTNIKKSAGRTSTMDV